GVEGAHRPVARPAARRGDGAGANRARGRVLRLAPAVPERRLLLRHHLPGDGVPRRDVPRAVRDPAHRGLARAVAGDADRPGAEDRAAAPGLHGPGPAGLRAAFRTLTSWRGAGLSLSAPLRVLRGGLARVRGAADRQGGARAAGLDPRSEELPPADVRS